MWGWLKWTKSKHSRCLSLVIQRQIQSVCPSLCRVCLCVYDCVSARGEISLSPRLTWRCSRHCTISTSDNYRSPIATWGEKTRHQWHTLVSTMAHILLHLDTRQLLSVSRWQSDQKSVTKNNSLKWEVTELHHPTIDTREGRQQRRRK